MIWVTKIARFSCAYGACEISLYSVLLLVHVDLKSLSLRLNSVETCLRNKSDLVKHLSGIKPPSGTVRTGFRPTEMLSRIGKETAGFLWSTIIIHLGRGYSRCLSESVTGCRLQSAGNQWMHPKHQGKYVGEPLLDGVSLRASPGDCIEVVNFRAPRVTKGPTSASHITDLLHGAKIQIGILEYPVCHVPASRCHAGPEDEFTILRCDPKTELIADQSRNTLAGASKFRVIKVALKRQNTR
jgi:hypothetical protein